MRPSDRAAHERRSNRSTYDRALDMLESRARSVVELRRALSKKGESPADIDAAIERLSAAGLLDDANYARQLARSKALNAGHSRRRIGQELAKRGVTRGVADDAIADVFDDEAVDEAAAIERVATKRLRMLSAVDPQARRRRLYAFLARRGYRHDEIQRTLDRLLADDAGSDE